MELGKKLTALRLGHWRLRSALGDGAKSFKALEARSFGIRNGVQGRSAELQLCALLDGPRRAGALRSTRTGPGNDKMRGAVGSRVHCRLSRLAIQFGHVQQRHPLRNGLALKVIPPDQKRIIAGDLLRILL